MATTMIVKINPRLCYQSDGTMAVIIYFSFYFWWKCAREFVGNKGNSRGKENGGWFIIKGMVTTMAMAIATVWEKRGLEKGGERENGRKGCFYPLFSFLTEGRKIVLCCLILLLFFVFPFSMQADWFHTKVKSILGWLSPARFLFQSKFGHHISVWQL